MSKKQTRKNPSKLGTLWKMLGLVKPLTSYMVLAVAAGTLAYLAVQFIPVLGGYAILSGLGLDVPVQLKAIWILLPVLALVRAVLRFIEQRLNHYIAFTLLAIVRDRVFRALRRLCPAKLEGKDKGDLVSLITSDVELLEVFYAHTISPICIAFIVETVMCIYIGTFHIGLGILALAAYLCVGIAVPLIISGLSGSMGDKVRKSVKGKLRVKEAKNHPVNAKKLKEVVADTPMEYLILETDCPYLAPVPFRGKRNSSLYLPYVVQEIARIKEIPEEEVVRITEQNARRLFRL